MIKISPHYVLLSISLLDMLSAGLIMPQMPSHIITLGGNLVTIGLMGTLYSAAQLISAPLIGSLSDLKGRKPIFLICLTICSISYLFLGLTSSLFIFLSLRAILGLSKQTQLLTKAITPDHVKDSRNQAVLYGRLAALSGLGMTIGPILGGHIKETYPEYGFTIITTITALLFIINFVLIKSLPDIKTEEDKNQVRRNSIAPELLDSIKKPLKESIEEFYKVDWTVFGDVFLYKLLLTLSMMMYFGSFGVFLKLEHSLSPKNLGYVISIQAITGSMCNLFVGYINDIYKNDVNFSQRNQHVFLGFTLSLIGLALAPNVYIFSILLVPLAVAGAVGRIVTLEMINKKASDGRRGTVIGASNSIKSLSGVVTPLVSGLINQYWGVKYGFYVAASITALGFVLSYRTQSKHLKAKKK